jgi:hypothetical protein
MTNMDGYPCRHLKANTRHLKPMRSLTGSQRRVLRLLETGSNLLNVIRYTTYTTPLVVKNILFTVVTRIHMGEHYTGDEVK